MVVLGLAVPELAVPELVVPVLVGSGTGRSGAGRSAADRSRAGTGTGRPGSGRDEVGQAAAGYRRPGTAQARGQGADPARGHAAGSPGGASRVGLGPARARQVGRARSSSGSRGRRQDDGPASFGSSGPPARAQRGTGDAAEFVAGRNSVVESLRAGVPSAALYVGVRVQHDERISEAIKLAADRGVAVLEAGAAELDRLTGGALHQGLALRVRPYDYAHPDDLLARAADAGQLPLIAALDGVTDPRNLGAVVRSAAAFGAHGVVVPGRRGAGVTAGAWKASAGALARVPVARAVNLARALQSYQDAGVFVAGLDAAGDTEIRDLELATAPLVLVIGSEGRGLSRIVGQACDVLVRIPIAARTESLNAGVAAGIALYEVAAVRSRLTR